MKKSYQCDKMGAYTVAIGSDSPNTIMRIRLNMDMNIRTDTMRVCFLINVIEYDSNMLKLECCSSIVTPAFNVFCSVS